VSRTAFELRRAAGDVRRAWGVEAWLATAALAAAALVPLTALPVDRLAGWLYLVLAGIGLAYAIGLAGLPSLAQGGLMAVGAFAAALLRAKAGWPLLPATVAATALATCAGLLVGVAVVRLRPAFVAVSTWLLAWLVALGLAAFPSISGGAEGLLLEPGLSATVHYELALGLGSLAALGFLALRHAPFGLRLSAARQRRPFAGALGLRVPRLRLGAFAGAAAIGGLAGALSVDLDGIADATAFGPFVSFELFVAVLLGGAYSALGAGVGLAAIWAVTAAAHALGSLEGVRAERFDPMLTAFLLLAVLAAGGRGIVPAVRSLLPGRAARLPAASRRPRPPGRASLAAEGLSKRFGTVDAVAGLELAVAPGQIVALVGPNGSGKTTALRLLAGSVPPDAGRIRLGGDELTPLSVAARVDRGLVRTPQATAVFPELTALENVLVAVPRRHGGALRSLVASPSGRTSEAEARQEALGVLERFGLARFAGRRADELPGFEQRVLMLATAFATRPRVLLVDEPAAGASPADLDRVAALLQGLRDDGLGLLVVEHHLRLVRRIADHVVVLAAGTQVAAGLPDAVGRDPAVRAAYLGTTPL
jgi:branched-chain amino acid transport system permease protein